MCLNDPVGHSEMPASGENSPRLDPSFIRHPRDLYHHLRAQVPAHRVTMWDGRHAWLVTRPAEAKGALSDPRLSMNRHQLRDLLPWGSYGPRWSMVNSYMLQQDSPEHARLRELVPAAFAVRSVKKFRPDMERIADELLDDVAVAAAAGDTVDLTRSYAILLPLRVISRLLGVPSGEFEHLRMHIEPLLVNTDAPILGAIECALADDLLDELIAEKRAQPQDDLLSELVHTTDEGGRLSHDELVSAALMLILAGYDTSAHLIHHGVLTLLRNPSQLMKVRADPSLLCLAVEEFLRFENPLNVATTRLTIETACIGGVEIPPGQLVFVSLPCGIDDASRWEFGVGTRPKRSGLPARSGVHHCVGVRVARLEGEIAIGRLLTRFEQITLADRFVARSANNVTMPGLTSLPVRISA
ncbi:cytochrome P450 [Mycobacterium colombiense]|uniref:cytochrome P450 n=1 Tax=Mycobacterium colombiense TaxID=339268 RepID=UPI0009E2A1E4|nr:cytochrome P450 [Mycobacterium colombiense]